MKMKNKDTFSVMSPRPANTHNKFWCLSGSSAHVSLIHNVSSAPLTGKRRTVYDVQKEGLPYVYFYKHCLRAFQTEGSSWKSLVA